MVFWRPAEGGFGLQKDRPEGKDRLPRVSAGPDSAVLTSLVHRTGEAELEPLTTLTYEGEVVTLWSCQLKILEQETVACDIK